MKTNKVISHYIKLVKKHLPCKIATRWVIGKEIKAAILDRFDEEDISLEMLCDNFGSPGEIASSFLEASSVGEMQKRIKRANVIVACVCVVALVILVAGIVLFYLANSYCTDVSNFTT